MKRILALIVMLTMLLAACSAQAAGSDLSYERLAEFGMYMRQLVAGDYMTLMGVPEDQQRIARAWAEGINETPRLAVRLNVYDSALQQEVRTSFIREPDMVRYEAESNNLSLILNTLIYLEAAKLDVTDVDYETIASINGSLGCRMIYAEEPSEGARDYAIYILVYDNAEPLIVLAAQEHNAVCLQAAFIPSKTLKKAVSSGTVAFWVMSCGMTITCDEVKPGVAAQ